MICVNKCSLQKNFHMPSVGDFGTLDCHCAQCCLVDWLGFDTGIYNWWRSCCSWHIPKSGALNFFLFNMFHSQIVVVFSSTKLKLVHLAFIF